MKKEFTHIERKGLPGGPNEMFTYVTGVFSTEGYKRNSPDVNNPFNIIPSGSITMKDVDFPVMGTDNLGNSEMMMPGNDYQFPGDQVFEVPMAKKGGGLLTKTMKCNSCGWSWKAADGGKDVSTCHKCGGSALPKAQDGEELPTVMTPEMTVQAFPNATPTQKAALSTKSGNPIYRNAKSQLMNNKQAGNFMEETQKATELALSPQFKILPELAAEATMLPSAYRVGKQIKDEGAMSVAKDVGTTLESFIMGSTPFSNTIPSPKEDWSGIGTTIDLAGAIPLATGITSGVKAGSRALINKATKPFALDLTGVGRQALGSSKFVPKQLPGSPNNFKSSIDWKKWVKYTDDFDNNPDVIKHLNEIEETTKANGTWMKNSDGSAFKGTQEEFVIQQSDNFKNAFKNTQILHDGRPAINIHGTEDNIEIFDVNKIRNRAHGNGIYFTPEGVENTYGSKQIKAYINSENPFISDNYEKLKNSGYSWTKDYFPELSKHTSTAPLNMKGNIMMHVVPDVNRIKSAKGNILFDMSNPNIYKSVIGTTLGGGAATQLDFSKPSSGFNNPQAEYQKGGDIDNTYYTNDPNDPRRYSYSDSAYLHDYSTAENKWFIDQQKHSFGEVTDDFIIMPTGIINSSDFDQWYKDNNVNLKFGNPFTADKVSNDAPAIVTDYNKIDPNSEYNNNDWSTGSNYNKDYLETSRNAPIPPESHTTYGSWWAKHPDIIKYMQEFKLGYDTTTGKYIPPSGGKDKSREPKVGLLEQVNQMLSNSMPTELQWVKPKPNSQSSKTTTTTSKGNTSDFEWSANAYFEFLKGMPKSVKGKPDYSYAIANFPAPRGSKPLEYGIVRPFVETESLDRKEYNPTLSKNLNIENVPEIKVNPSKELPWYQRTGFNSGLQRIQPSNYDPNNTTLRGEPFQMDMQGNIYQSGGSLPKAQDGNGEYTVESGNTFDGIANKLGINKQTLRQVNPGINYNELQVGQTIKYPAQKPEPTSWGDYMNPMNWGVSNRDDDGDFKQAFRTAREAGEDEFMWYGTRYSTDLKKTANKSQVQVEKTSDKLEPAKETKPPEGKTEKYTVKSGDTFDGIVNKKEVSKYFLKKVNPNVDYGNLNVGQVINLPDKKKDTLGVDEIENYLTITNGQTPDFWKSTADTIAFHESGPWQPMDPEAIQKSQNKKTGNFFKGPGEGVFQIETERAGGKNSFKQFKNRYESVADKLNMYADPKIINASRPIDLSLEEQYALFYTNLMEEPNVILKDYAQGDMSLIDLWLAGHKKVEKPGDRDAFRTSVERLKEEKTIFKKSGGEVDEFQVYANYINGSYNGTEMETKAEKIYDKLNRVYYRKAKALDMSAPNYIMSNIINRSGQ